MIRLKNKKLIIFVLAILPILILAPTAIAATPITIEVKSELQLADLASVQEDAVFTIKYALAGGMTIEENVKIGETVRKTPGVPDTTRTFVGWKDETGNFVVPADITIYKDETFNAFYIVKLNTADHNKYMNGNPSGLFKPEDPLTRGEACQMLYSLVTEIDEITVSFPDVAKNIWYYKPVSTMASMGLIFGDELGNFKPDSNITRAAFVAILTRFYPIAEGALNFSDLTSASWAAEAVSSAEAMGWINVSSDGLFRPNDAITRAEAVVIMNRVLKRTASPDVIDSAANIRIFPDLFKDSWAYYDIMEAAIDHHYSKTSGTEVWSSYTEETANIEPGFQLIDGQLYYENGNGYFIHNTTFGTFTFDWLGRSTTGNEELDTYITAAVLRITNPSMTQFEMLRAAHNYTRDNFTYLIRNYYATGDTGWEVKEGLIMFQTGRGNCYCFTSVFYWLSRRLGYDSIAISGEVGARHNPHGWVEIVFDNENYIFDADLERAYRKNGVSSYDLFYLSYADVPWSYVKLIV